MTRESKREEIEALRNHCAACQHLGQSAWEILPHIRLDQAVALPVTEEVGTALRTFTIGERLTPHVRHRQKYVDVPVSNSRAFVFGSGRRGVVARAHTLREFVEILESLNVNQVEGYLRRGDFSRWIGDVFGDHALERELQRHERRDEKTEHRQALDEIVAAIRSRYDLTDDSDVVAVSEPRPVTT